MSGFKASLYIGANASEAKAEVAATRAAIKDLGTTTETTGRKTKSAEAATKSLGGAASGAAVKTKVLSDAERQATITANQLRVANSGAAGSMGNLVAQFNDVGVMMAAGQNPLQLALQQGTQITQVIGPMGAAGAVKALGGAFMSMLSPINLITIGSLAAGAAMIQWLSGADEKAKSFEDRLDETRDMLDRYREASENARLPTTKLVEKFGEGAEAARRYYEELARIEGRRTQGSAIGLITSLTQDYYDARDLFDLRSTSASERRMAAGQAELSQQAGLAQGLDQQIQAAETLYNNAVALSQVRGGRSAEEDAYIQQLAEALLILREQKASEGDVLRLQRETNAELLREADLNRLIEQFGSQSAVVANAKLKLAREAYQVRLDEQGILGAARDEAMSAFDAANQARNPFSEWASSAFEFASAKVASNVKEFQSGQELLTQMQEQNAIQQAIAEHGDNSAQAAELRAEAERRAFEETLATMEVSEGLKNELRAAFEQGQALSLLDMASGVGAAGDEARRLADLLDISYQSAVALAALGPQGLPGEVPQGGRGGDPREQGGRAIDWQTKDGGEFLDNWTPPKKPRSRRSGRGGASKIEKQRKATSDLITNLEDELAILRETDPVQQEMLRHREALAGATEAERAKISDLIATRNREKTAIDDQKAAWDSYRDIAYGTFEDLRRSGGDLGSVLDTLSGKIADMAFQALLLGEGPLAGIFGTSGGGGLIDLALGAIFPGAKPATQKLVDGGMVYGPGSGTSDQVALWGSSGEFMVNARATAKNRSLLEMINAGADIPGFAKGGMIGGGAGSGASPAQPVIYVENNSSAKVTQTTQSNYEGKAGRGTKFVLADAVGEAMSQPGGGAKRLLTNSYGLRKKGALR